MIKLSMHSMARSEKGQQYNENYCDNKWCSVPDLLNSSKEKTKITKAIQVCYELTTRNKRREIEGLVEAMDFFELDCGYILTLDQEEDIHVAGRKISVIPARKFAY